MPTAAQINARNAAPYQRLVRSLADAFTPGDSVHSRDIPALNDDQLSVVLNHETEIGFDAASPSDWADILNSTVHVTHEERLAALGRHLRDAINREALDWLAADIETELDHRSEPYLGSPAERAMDEAGHRATDFA